MNDDVDTGEEMVDELGLDGGAFSTDDRQRFDLLRKWHSDEAAAEAAERERKKDKTTGS